jgi:hypothetical protein
MYAFASVLLPGSGLPAIVGIADIILALACSYLVLLEPAGARRVARRSVRESVAAAIKRAPRRTREVLPPVPATSTPISPEIIQEKVA